MVSLVEDIFARSKETESFILDAEIVAIDPVDGSLKSFQELSNRARRDVKLEEVKVSVSVFAFDLMYLNGEASRYHSCPTSPLIPCCLADPPREALPTAQVSPSLCLPAVSA